MSAEPAAPPRVLCPRRPIPDPNHVGGIEWVAAERLAGLAGLDAGTARADARALAYRLYEIASQEGWASEALIYNELAQEWPKLEELASEPRARDAGANAQGSLF